jgi:hypothetical protein
MALNLNAMGPSKRTTSHQFHEPNNKFVRDVLQQSSKESF